MSAKILYIQYTDPNAWPPLEHSSTILANKGWQVLFLGIRALGEVDKLGFKPHPQIELRYMPFCLPGWRQKVHYLQFCLWVLAWGLYWRPKIIYASDLFSCPVALILSFIPGFKVIYHEHDSPTITPQSSFMHICYRARKWLANRTQISVLPNQQRLEEFVIKTDSHQKTCCVWNCPTQEEIASPYLLHQEEDLWLLYHGNISSSLLPPTVLKALTKLPKAVKLRVIGYETSDNQGYVQQLKSLACQLELEDRVEFLGAMPRNELLGWCKRCHIGIVCMPQMPDNINMRYMVGASNKVFDYLSCGLALLVIDISDWNKTFVEPGYGLNCNYEDPISIARALRWYLEHPTQMRQMGELGRQRVAQEWNYEKQFEPVLAQMSV